MVVVVSEAAGEQRNDASNLNGFNPLGNHIIGPSKLMPNARRLVHPRSQKIVSRDMENEIRSLRAHVLGSGPLTY